MGLFKKRVTDPDEIERLKAEIAAMGARLNATEHDKQQLDSTVRALVDRLDTSTPAPPPPPPSTPVTAKPDTAEIDKLNARIERLASQLRDRADEAAIDVDPAELERLTARVDALGQRLDQPDQTVDPAELERLTARVDALGQRLDDAAATEATQAAAGVDPAEMAQLHEKVDDISRRIAELDQRISSISTELANQITELSGELDAIDGAAPGGEVVEELRDAQERLANEQARYQIAFRQDLAELADRLRRA